jgi:hypothetical protein
MEIANYRIFRKPNNVAAGFANPTGETNMINYNNGNLWYDNGGDYSLFTTSSSGQSNDTGLFSKIFIFVKANILSTVTYIFATGLPLVVNLPAFTTPRCFIILVGLGGIFNNGILRENVTNVVIEETGVGATNNVGAYRTQTLKIDNWID